MCNDNLMYEAINRLTQAEKNDMLMVAVDRDRPYLVRFAIALGAEVNQTSSKDVSPIGRAVLNNNVEIAKILIEAGADLKYSYYPVHQCTMNYNYSMIKLLVMSGAPVLYGGDFFEVAAANEDADFLNYLLSVGVKVTMQQKRTAIDNNTKTDVIEIIKKFEIKR